jgi:neutral ceramidase
MHCRAFPRCRVGFVWAVTCCMTLSAQEAKKDFKAGFAERDITPDIGMESPGGYGKSYHRTLHDPCKVRAAVFDDGQQRVALVGLDALFIHRSTTMKVRQAISQKTGIPAEAILLGASHSHSSGPMSGVMPGEYDDASPLIQALAYEKSTCADSKYLAHVEQAIVEAVTAADAARTEVQAGIGRGSEPFVSFNRRFRVRAGFTITHPGQNNPDIVEPAGPTDPEVGVIGVWKESRLIGCVVNFACHATTSPGGISANYIHYLEKAIRGYYGPEVVVVFLNGASGDVTQVDNRNPFVQRAPEKWAEFVGARVGLEAVKVLISMEPGTLTPVLAKTKTWSIPHRVPSVERVKRSLEMVQQEPTKVGVTEWTFAKEIVLLDHKMKKEPKVEVEVQAVQIGPAVFVTTPAEYFCQYGLEIKERSGFPFTFPVSLANGCVGYVPTEEAFGPHGGGYETRLTSYSNLEITAGNQFRDVGIELARQLQPGAVPLPSKALPFKGEPWSYGNVKPELD